MEMKVSAKMSLHQTSWKVSFSGSFTPNSMRHSMPSCTASKCKAEQATWMFFWSGTPMVMVGGPSAPPMMAMTLFVASG